MKTMKRFTVHGMVRYKNHQQDLSKDSSKTLGKCNFHKTLFASESMVKIRK